MWIEPIIDRALSDIQNLTDKGYLNYTDLNRIEANAQYLHEVLLAYGYSQNPTTKTDWVMSDFPYLTEMERVRANVAEIVSGYYAQDTTVPTSIESLTWQKLNDLESVLLETKEMIARMEQSFKYVGTFYAGQEVILP